MISCPVFFAIGSYVTPLQREDVARLLALPSSINLGTSIHVMTLEIRRSHVTVVKDEMRILE